MDTHYPEPRELDSRIPPHQKTQRFSDVFRHALKDAQLDRAEYMRLSFREGYRVAKLYLRKLRHSRGILEFPARWRVRIRAT